MIPDSVTTAVAEAMPEQAAAKANSHRLNRYALTYLKDLYKSKEWWADASLAQKKINESKDLFNYWKSRAGSAPVPELTTLDYLTKATSELTSLEMQRQFVEGDNSVYKKSQDSRAEFEQGKKTLEKIGFIMAHWEKEVTRLKALLDAEDQASEDDSDELTLKPLPGEAGPVVLLPMKQETKTEHIA